MWPTNSGVLQLACNCAAGQRWFAQWLKDREAAQAAPTLADATVTPVDKTMAAYDEGVRDAIEAACSAPPSTRMQPAALRAHIMREVGIEDDPAA